jgi:hypothetical protein
MPEKLVVHPYLEGNTALFKNHHDFCSEPWTVIRPASSSEPPTVVADSPLEESGFELLVPPGKGTASFEANLINRRHLLLPKNQASGTEGSNPLSPGGESTANLMLLPVSGGREKTDGSSQPLPSAGGNHRRPGSRAKEKGRKAHWAIGIGSRRASATCNSYSEAQRPADREHI